MSYTLNMDSEFQKNLKRIPYSIIILLLLVTTAWGQSDQPEYLHRSLDSVSEVDMEISTETAHYKPFFGAGDEMADLPESVSRYGYLRINPEGESEVVNYGREELVYYVLEGTGMLRYKEQEIPISQDDFFYVPIDTDHGFMNAREDTLNVMVMGFPVPETREVEPTTELQLASANDVSFQVLGELGHGPTSRFRLLLGPTDSQRDRISAAYQVNSMYVIDFDFGGTNNPHRHEHAEEIYFVMQGEGEMVAGETPDGEPRRIKVQPGDAFFYTANSLVGFYSAKEGDERARILAVRSRLP